MSTVRFRALATGCDGAQEWQVQSTHDTEAQLFVRARGHATDERPSVVLVHGFFQPASAILDVPGYSLQQALANTGLRVYLFDMRGYGLASRPAFMTKPADQSRPGLGCMAHALEDLRDVLAFVRTQEGSEVVDLVGYSWGTARSASYALAYPDQVRRLALYAPVWRPTSGAAGEAFDPQNPQQLNPRWGGYASFRPGDLQRNWDWEIDGQDAGLFRSVEALAAADRALVTSDPTLGALGYRAPLGPMVDALAVAQGRPLFAAHNLHHNTLLVRGAQDRLASGEDAEGLFAALGSARKKLVTLERGTHLLHVEHAAGTLVQEIAVFLQQD